MNGPLRRIAMFCVVMLVSVMASTTWYQFAVAGDLNKDERNTRSIIEQLGRYRGTIVAGKQVVAESVPASDQYRYQRTYPANQIYSHISGVFPISGAPTGLEKTEFANLAGIGDSFFYSNLTDMLTGKEPQGANVELTINPAAQQAAWDALGDQKGAVVALDPTTGAILALVSKPAFDPNQLAAHDSGAVAAANKRLREDENGPLENRAIASKQYPPGSVFKVLMSAVALENGYQPGSMLPGGASITPPGTTVPLTNHGGGPCGPNDQVTLDDALRKSCNVAFGSLAMELGEDKIAKKARDFGFGQDLEIPLRVTPSRIPEKMSKDVLSRVGIGQNEVRVTPMQVAMLAAGVANSGVLMKPYLVQNVRAADQSIISSAQPAELHRVLSAQNATALRGMMRHVVESGTGVNAQIPGTDVAGKTGTAQNAKNKADHAWFTAFAPAGDTEQAKVAVAVIVENGGEDGNETSGGRTAAPIAQKVVKAVLGK